MLLSGAESTFTLLEDIETEDLLSDKDEILVRERNHNLRIVRAPARGRISGRRQAEVNAVRAREITEYELAVVPRNPDVAGGEVGILTYDHVAFEATDV